MSSQIHQRVKNSINVRGFRGVYHNPDLRFRDLWIDGKLVYERYFHKVEFISSG